MSTTERGTVKWFNDAKGFGFINHKSGKDVFVHYSVIQSEGFKTLKDGELVDYELSDGPKGFNAAKVFRLIQPSAEAASEAPAPGLSNQIEVIRTEDAASTSEGLQVETVVTEVTETPSVSAADSEASEELSSH